MTDDRPGHDWVAHERLQKSEYLWAQKSFPNRDIVCKNLNKVTVSSGVFSEFRPIVLLKKIQQVPIGVTGIDHHESIGV